MPIAKKFCLAPVAALLAACVGVAFASPSVVLAPVQHVRVSASSPVTVPPMPPSCPTDKACAVNVAAASPVTVPPMPPSCPTDKACAVDLSASAATFADALPASSNELAGLRL